MPLIWLRVRTTPKLWPQWYCQDSLALPWVFSTCWSCSASDRQPGCEAVPFTHAQHEERRKMSLQAMALCFGRSGVWDPQHGDSLAPLLLESRDPRCILPKSCLCWGYVSLTEKFVWLLFASETSPVLCSCVLGSGFYLFRQWLHMRGECREDNEAADFGFRLCKAWNWLWGPGSWKWHW